MEILVLAILISTAVASVYDELDQASAEVVADFLFEIDSSPSLRKVAGLGQSGYQGLGQLELDVNNGLCSAFKEALDDVLRGVRDSVEETKQICRDVFEKTKQIGDKLNAARETGVQEKDSAKRIEAEIRKWLQLFSEVGINTKSYEIEKFNLKSLLQKLVEKIIEKLNIHRIKEYIREVFGEFTGVGRALLKFIQNQGLYGIKEIAFVILSGNTGEVANYNSLLELWRRIQDFFKGLGLEVQEKFFLFADWVRITVNGGLTNVKEQVDKVKEIAKQVVENSKTMSKEVAREALEFFEPFKGQLGQLYDDAKAAINRVLGRL